MKKFITKEFSPLLMLIGMVVIFLTVTAFGLIHLLLKSVKDTFQMRFWKGPLYFIKYWLNVLYQIWNSIKFITLQVAIGLDMMENVLGGEALEDIITAEENTLFGKGNITVSTATGQLEFLGKLNKKGVKWSKLLSRVLDKNHAVVSYMRWLHNKQFEL